MSIFFKVLFHKVTELIKNTIVCICKKIKLEYEPTTLVLIIEDNEHK